MFTLFLISPITLPIIASNEGADFENLISNFFRDGFKNIDVSKYYFDYLWIHHSKLNNINIIPSPPLLIAIQLNNDLDGGKNISGSKGF